MLVVVVLFCWCGDWFVGVVVVLCFVLDGCWGCEVFCCGGFDVGLVGIVVGLVVCEFCGWVVCCIGVGWLLFGCVVVWLFVDVG